MIIPRKSYLVKRDSHIGNKRITKMFKKAVYKRKQNIDYSIISQ